MPAEWSPSDQLEFESHIADITTSAGFPVSWVDNVEVRKFCERYILSAKLPSQKVLNKRILPAEVKSWDSQAKLECVGANVLLQCDGWSAINFRHLIAFMLNTKRRIHAVKILDMTHERKTAELLLKHMLEVIDHVQKDWEVKVIAFTSDASGESCKARHLLLAQHPWLVAPDCYAHQVRQIYVQQYATH
ncbi:hypothetical protein BOTBODRAFT_99690 [Botryobasidium botryosum FD-172 SS1]|uniref:DUF659 domain-containing protein n=1 Tax=Botryobasidium botryosum (strain FD-172 SS1) TaxID=930990 RepID=A0A067N373_BOTB1|nr:hypothetical protein BOTBODRAFT_99690 [Botryobasidium botryosum FD-172 SS1]